MPETSTKIDILSGGMVGMISILIGHPFDTVRSDFKLMLCRRPCERMETNLSVQGTGGTILLVRWRERGYFLHLQSFTLSVSLKQTRGMAPRNTKTNPKDKYKYKANFDFWKSFVSGCFSGFVQVSERSERD